MSREEYNKLPYPSYSALKFMENHPFLCQIFMVDPEKLQPTGESIQIGTLVDDYLSGNTDKYVISSDIKRPTGKMLDLANEFIKIKKMYPDIEDSNAILTARKNIDYNKNLADITVINKFEDECSDFVNFYLNNENKVLINEDLDEWASKVLYEFKNDKFINSLYDKGFKNLYSQEPLVAEYVFNENVEAKPIKGIPDLVLFNDFTKEAVIIDFKTISFFDFSKNYANYKYYIQSRLYEALVSSYLKIPKRLVKFYFYVIYNYENNLQDVITGWFTESEELKEITLKGNYYTDNYHLSNSAYYLNNNVYIKTKGLNKLIDEFYFHMYTGIWDKTYEEITKGVKQL